MPEHILFSVEYLTPKPLTQPYGRRSGGDYRDRTDDPLLAKQVLSQLS